PGLCRVNESAVGNICSLSQQMAKVEKFLDKATDEAMAQFVRCDGGTAIIDIEKMRKYDEIIRERVVYRIISDAAGMKKDIERIHVEYVLGLMDGVSGKRVDLPYGLAAKREYNLIYVGKTFPSKVYDWELQVFTDLDSKDEFVAKLKNEYPEKKVCTIEIDYDKIEIGLVLRNRQPGDFITIDRNGRHKTVKKFFIDEKLPLSDRDMPIVFDGSEAVWIVGRRQNSRYAIGQDTGVKAFLVVAGTGL
ncbi:MAG: tRNA lysidine(34) synthetase TilS, partial [Lachnospiraceae bacterium]